MPTVVSSQLNNIGLITAFALTILVLASIASHKLSHLTQSLLVGITTGYVAAIVWKQLLIARLVALLQNPTEHWYYGIFFIIGLLLFLRKTPRLSQLAGIPLTLLASIGAGLALAGSISGTLIEQISATIKSLSPEAYGAGISGLSFALDALIMILSTVSVLLAFRYLALQREGISGIIERAVRPLGAIGKAIIAIVMGALLTGALITFYTLLIDRLEFVLATIPQIIQQVRL